MNSYKENMLFKDNDLIQLKIRRSIYRFILENPGLYLSELSRKLNIPKSTLRYHLNYLEKQELLTTNQDYKYKRYFVKKDIGYIEKKTLNIVRLETTRNVLLYIMIVGVASQTELAKELIKHPTTIDFHLKRLLKYNIIEQAPAENGVVYTRLRTSPIIKRKKSKNEVFYRMKEPQIIEKLLILYYTEGYYDDIISEAILSYGEDVTKNTPVKRIKTSEEVVDLVEKIFYDIFPHPYHA